MTVIVQVSDPHIGADWDGADPLDTLGAVVADVRRLPDRPSAILLTGDIAEHADDAEYAAARDVLAATGVPVVALAGNHDARAPLRRAFGAPGADDWPVRHAVDIDALRVVALDTLIPGTASGRVGAEQLAWLDAQLALAPERPTIVAMHHPPIVTGAPAWDAMGLPDADRSALADVIARHAQVRRLVAGHVHHAVVGELAGVVTVLAPSTYKQMQLDLSSPDFRLTDAPPGFVVHTLLDGEVRSHVHAVTGPA